MHFLFFSNCKKILQNLKKTIDKVKKMCYNILVKHEQMFDKRKATKKMYETVKVVNGHAITRMIGTRGFYYVNVREGKGFREFHTFRTIKAAAAFCETLK